MKFKFLLFLICSASIFAENVTGWLHWRGPHQNGTSDETGLIEEIELGGKNHLWSFEMAGQGSAVMTGKRVYAFGYSGEGADLREYLTCLNAENGEVIWQHGFNDFLSDIVYERYSIGSPSIDSETGNVYLMTTAGEMCCFSPEGKMLWNVSMMERFGLLTFPNGRRGAAVIEGDLVIHHCITSYWGADGPARDRFFAFRKKTGELVWSSTPGIAPKDSSFSSPVISSRNGRRVLYSGTGCGNVIALNARTGEPFWRFPFSFGGVNSSVLLHKNMLIAIHGKENLDTSEVGRMAAIQIGNFEKVEDEKVEDEKIRNELHDLHKDRKDHKDHDLHKDQFMILDRSFEVWRQPLVMFTSSPVLIGDRICQVTHTGELECLNANTGDRIWHHKLENGQLHASPLYADGKLFVPMMNGNFYILKLKEDGVEELDVVKLNEALLGSPTLWNGKLFLQSKKRLYCFGKRDGMLKGKVWKQHFSPKKRKGKMASLQVVPADVLLNPGEKVRVEVRALDENGNVLRRKVRANFQKFIPKNAKVKTEMDARFEGRMLFAENDAMQSAGAFRAFHAEHSDVFGMIRGRIFPKKMHEDFEGFALSETYPEGHLHHGVHFSYPPLAWIGARLKWDIREKDGNKVLAKTLDRVLFQRATTFIGDPEMSEYTLEADVMTDGNRRMKSNVGLINQRYVVELVGNWQLLEVSSNHDRIKVSVPFKWNTKTWYRLKSRVDLNDDGSGIVRAKAWKKDEAEPKNWTIEVPHKIAHRKGSPGLRGFSPQSRFSVYVDNIAIYPNSDSTSDSTFDSNSLDKN